MKGVIDPIKVRTHGDAEWELLEDFEWNGIVVKEGFVTDFASIPAAVRGWINPVGRIRPAALVHDWLYHRRGKLPGRTLSRKASDRVFLKIMEYVDFSFIKRISAYAAVRSVGWRYWNKKVSEDKVHSKRR